MPQLNKAKPNLPLVIPVSPGAEFQPTSLPAVRGPGGLQRLGSLWRSSLLQEVPASQCHIQARTCERWLQTEVVIILYAAIATPGQFGHSGMFSKS